MRYLNATEVRRLIADDDYLNLVEHAYGLFGVERNVASRPAASIVTAAHEPPSVFPIKGAVTTTEGAIGLLFGAQFGEYYFAVNDSRTGKLQGLIEQSSSTRTRTAATAVVVASWFADPGAKVAAVIGGGGIGAEVARLLPLRFPHLETLRVASRTLDGARAFAARVQPGVPCPVTPCATAAEAIDGADIVVTITVATAPMVFPGMLKKGAFLCSLGGVHEVDFGVLGDVDRLIVDDLGYALLRGDFAHWVERGEISRSDLERRIAGDVGDVAAGRVAKRQDNETVMAVVQGLTLCDLVVARTALQRAAAAGVGAAIPVQQQMERPDEEKLRTALSHISAHLQKRAQ